MLQIVTNLGGVNINSEKLDNLKKLRKQRNLTQEKVAKEIGISRVSYTTIENGTRKPNLSTAIKLASFFGKTVEELF